MKDFAATVEGAMVDWWSKTGRRENLEFRFNSTVEQRISDARPIPYPTPKDARMTRFLGMPVLVDEGIPAGEVHVVDHNGKLCGKITGLNDV